MAAPLDPAQRKRILRVLFTSLLLDLVSLSKPPPHRQQSSANHPPDLLHIHPASLPLPPLLLPHPRPHPHLPPQPHPPLPQRLQVLLRHPHQQQIRHNPPRRRPRLPLLPPPSHRLPPYCRASDTYGRRTALLYSMAGNIASVALWCAATDFRTFLASRVVGGLSEGNVQLATAIAADISTEEQRGSTMAMVGACFSVAFTFGPALGAWLASITTVSANPFATAAGFSLFLVVVETIYLYTSLPETKPVARDEGKRRDLNGHVRQGGEVKKVHTNAPWLLNTVHFLFLLPFSGMEFSLPFLITSVLYPDHPSPSKMNGRLLGFVGLIASVLQGSVVGRMPALTIVKVGVVSCTIAFFLLSMVQSTGQLYAAGGLLAVTSATVVTGLNSLGSFEAKESNRGEVLGTLRSWGQFGRALGPIVFCSMFWWLGRETAYQIGGACMLAVVGVVFVALRAPVIAKTKAR